jgi:hypothetical protein
MDLACLMDCDYAMATHVRDFTKKDKNIFFIEWIFVVPLFGQLIKIEFYKAVLPWNRTTHGALPSNSSNTWKVFHVSRL